MPYVASIGKLAFSMAGMAPVDVGVAEVLDYFTGIDLIGYEDLGFAERYGADKRLEEVTTIGGGLPKPSAQYRGLTAVSGGHDSGRTEY